MRSPVRLLQNIWFCEAKEEHEGIDLTKEYTKPIKKRMRVSWTMGYVRGNSIGWDLLYDRYADNYDRNFKPVEGTFCFVDVEPVLDNDGNLATEDVPELNLDGTPKVDGDGNPIYEDVPVTYYELKPVVQVGSTAYYTVDDSKSTVTRKSTEVTTAKTSAKVITYTYSSNWMTKLNKGAYYAGAGSKNVSYWDKSTRRTIYSKWHIYKKVATINGMAYVTSYKDNVANKGPLPKGYKGVKSNSFYYSGKTTYSHVLKNGTLTIAA